MIIALLPGGGTEQAQRGDAVEPINAKRNVVAKILRVARENASELHALWEKTHGGN